MAPPLTTPLIEDYALIGGMNTAALISPDGRIDWLCLPRFDSPAVCARLLGEPEHGYWALGPSPTDGPQPRSARRYLGTALVLETMWDTHDGRVRVLDFMPPHTAETTPVQLVRVVEGVSGRVTMRSALRARYGYGSIAPWVRAEGERVALIAGADALWLDAPLSTLDDGAVVSE
ncbi:trehalase-like domain-containing protein, partial [Streptomyces sp. NPDC003860]